MDISGITRLRLLEMCIRDRRWIPIKDLDKYKAFPTFLGTYFSNKNSGIRHIVTDERGQASGLLKS